MSKNHYARTFISLLLLVVLASCGTRRFDYGEMLSVSPEIRGEDRIGLVVVDKRPYVLNGKKTPDFVGLSRPMWGIPFDAKTESHQPLATELRRAFASSLRERGFVVDEVDIPGTITQDEINSQVSGLDVRKYLLMEVAQWRTSGKRSKVNSFDYDITLYVKGQDGTTLGTQRVNGIDRVGGEGGPKRKNIREAIEDVLSTLINANAITTALTTTVAPVAGALASAKHSELEPAMIRNVADRLQQCSVERVLEMQSIGLSSAQIKALCK